ncbi:sugar transferase [Sphingopyxis sp. BSN-002]|uniref:sugar transferase n=1 Tax=Sphingopyxis sp. BSN-002 TaxID=2911495 RepID=UPI001EDB1791|nr:sugar transferase [Sphingopyxis sp. BSN-002]UKK85250.1 sugar transferase [Sphingopyxis sp. BSN-002]
MLKRGFDLVISALLFVPAVLVCLVAALFSGLEFRANPLFVQSRVGRDQRPFRLYKIRTMAPTTGDRPSHEVAVTRISRSSALIRKLKLDELPQLICVLRGEMSLVGPRPCLPIQHELIDARERHGVFRVRPGVTGLAQVQGVDMSEPERLAAIDGDYVANQSLVGDMRILLHTFGGGGRGDAAQR